VRKVPGMALLVVAGIALRVASIYPLYKWDADFDDVLTSISAIGILQGHFPVYLRDQRLGALEAYLHAGPFALFGVSRLSQSIPRAAPGDAGEAPRRGASTEMTGSDRSTWNGQW